MPNATLSAALAEAYAAAPSSEVVFDTLEFRHAALAEPIRVVNHASALTATLEAHAPLNPGEAVSFAACGFEFDLPEISEGVAPVLTMAIDNVDREIVAALERLSESADRLYVTYRPYLASDLSAPHMDPVWHLTVLEISANVQRIEAKASLADLFNRKFPADTYTLERFPGLANFGG
jgi:hypothetical protein